MLGSKQWKSLGDMTALQSAALGSLPPRGTGRRPGQLLGPGAERGSRCPAVRPAGLGGSSMCPSLSCTLDEKPVLVSLDSLGSVSHSSKVANLRWGSWEPPVSSVRSVRGVGDRELALVSGAEYSRGAEPLLSGSGLTLVIDVNTE